MARSMTSIQKMNTMGFDVVAKHFYEINSLIELDNLIEKNIFKDDKIMIYVIIILMSNYFIRFIISLKSKGLETIIFSLFRIKIDGVEVTA